MLGALISQVKGVFGKAYLFAGLVPAALLVAGWAWDQAGSGGLQRATSDLFVATKGNTGAPLLRAFVLLALALLFFAIRQPLVIFVQTLPVPFIRHTLVYRQLRRRRRAQVDLEFALTQRTAAGCPGRGFAQLYVYPSVLVPSTADAVAESQKARGLIDSALAGRRSQLDFRAADKILHGLTGIVTLKAQCRRCISEVESEIGEWTALSTRQGIEKIMAAVEFEADRRFVSARRRLDRWPAEAWIEPTALGNRQAALDDYAQSRYGIDTGNLWTRLVGVLDPAERVGVADAELSVEVMVNLCVALAVLAIGAAFVALLDATGVRSANSSAWTAVPFVAISLLSARAAYEGAVYAHQGLALRVIRLVDLRRLRLAQELGYTVTTVEDEIRLFKELKGFFSSATPRSPSRSIGSEQQD